VEAGLPGVAHRPPFVSERSRTSAPHLHLAPFIADGLLPIHWSEQFDDMWVGLADFIRVWNMKRCSPWLRPNLYFFHHPEYQFRPLSKPGSRDKPERGWLIVRLKEIPAVFESLCLNWFAGLHRANRDRQRLAAAKLAFNELEEDGLLDEHSPAPPARYSVAGLEETAKAFCFSPVEPF
jgi:hypothetical protein